MTDDHAAVTEPVTFLLPAIERRHRRSVATYLRPGPDL